MGTESWIIALIVILVIGGVAWFTLRQRSGKQRSKSQFKGLGILMKAEASSEVTPAVVIEDAKAHKGSIVATDNTGRGIHGKKLDAKQDITFTNIAPQDDLPKT